VDFSREMVIGIFRGKGWNCEGIELLHALDCGETLEVFAQARDYQTVPNRDPVCAYGTFVLPKSPQKLLVKLNSQAIISGPPLWKVIGEFEPLRDRASGQRAVVNPQGTVVALTAKSITVSNRNAMAGAQTVFPLSPELVVRRLKPIGLMDLKEPTWATVFKEPGRHLSEAVAVFWLKVADNTPAARESSDASANSRNPPLAIRVSASGVLSVRGTNATLQTEGHTLNLRFAPWTRFYRESPATLSDVESGAEVILDFVLVDRSFVVRGIDLLPRAKVSAPSVGPGTVHE
jgi:hypothetical protein